MYMLIDSNIMYAYMYLCIYLPLYRFIFLCILHSSIYPFFLFASLYMYLFYLFICLFIDSCMHVHIYICMYLSNCHFTSLSVFDIVLSIYHVIINLSTYLLYRQRAEWPSAHADCQ